jgi:hypothetical protein
MRTKQVRPDKLDFEYELYISREHDNVVKKDFILFNLITKKEFENFAYEINVIPVINLPKKELQFNVEGLSAPKLDIPKTGNAFFRYKLYDFKNEEYTLKLLKYSKGKIIYKFKINPGSVKITHSPEHTFIKIITQ